MVSRVDLHHFLIMIWSIHGENHIFFQVRNEAISIGIDLSGVVNSFIFEFNGLSLAGLGEL